ncbi:MAG: alkaline shock response membrane anchor protein AmaP [Firmicutes bacterium]|nr:alkaline shock response membrane anchor protein AmaP [Bacillota bacterium]
MGAFDRVILVLYTFTIALLLLAAAVFFAGWQEPFTVLLNEVVLPAQMEIIWVLIALYVIIGARLFWKGLAVKRDKKQAVVQDGEFGDVRIALPAIESLAAKVTAPLSGVKDVQAKVISTPSGISMQMTVTVAPDISLPELSKDIQRQVKDNLFNVAGITVNEVRVAVESFTSRKNRVE